MAETAAAAPSSNSTLRTNTGQIPPNPALELRLRQLESSIGSSSSSQLDTTPSNHKPLLLRALAAHKQIEASTSSHHALRRFIKEYESNRRILDPGFRVTRGGSSAEGEGDRGGESYHAGKDILSVPDQLVLVQDAEVELRAMERVLLECQALDQRGVAGSGNLAGYESLKEPLSKAWNTHREEVAPKHAQLEERLFTALQSYQTNIDTMSRLFIEWDQTLKDVEGKVGRLEREKAQRER